MLLRHGCRTRWRVFWRLSDALSRLSEAVPGQHRHDDALHLRRRRDACARRERHEPHRNRGTAELCQSHQVSVRLYLAGE